MSSLIRRPVDQCSLSTPHSFSQTATSFIACNRQGIHHIHLVTWSYNPTAYCPVESQVTHNVVRCFSNLKVLKNSFLSLNAITTRFQSIRLRLSLNQRLRLDWNALLTKLLKNILLIDHEQISVSIRRCDNFSPERRWSSRTFRYCYLVTTSPQSWITKW